MRVRVRNGRSVFAKGTVYVAGQTLDVSSNRAERLIATGFVEVVVVKKTKAKRLRNK